jgi:nucleoside-diphosphate-sugar epimerase
VSGGGTAPAGSCVLLTGASGFLGRHLAAALLAEGYRVRAALRRPDPALPAGIEVVEIGDLAGPQDWRSHLAGIDAVVHGAGIAHAGPGLPEALYDRVNCAATLDLAAAAAGRVGRFVFLSSIRAQCGPSADHVLSEAEEPRPTDAYGRSKLAAERGLAGLDLASVSLRPVVVYGPGVGGNVGLLLRLARTGLPLPFGALRARRSLLSIENLVAAVLLALSPDVGLTGPVIVADPAPLALGDLLRAMRHALGRAPLLVPVPEGVMAAGLSLVGRRDMWERLAGALEVDPRRLLNGGWRPPVATTEEGVRRWLAPRAPRA